MLKKALIHYKIRWKPTGIRPGSVRGVTAGVGDRLRALVPLRDHPDPRRLDLRASMRDPFERLYVRDFYLNTAFKVIVLLDTSASMGYVGKVSRIQVAQDISAQLALSAYRAGDGFGFFAANDSIHQTLRLPPKLNRSAWLWVNKQLAQFKPSGQGVAGLLHLTPHLPQKRSLVFIISDFRWPLSQLKQLLKQLSHHDVVPIMLEDPAEAEDMPSSGIAVLNDVETGDNRFVWLRPSLVKQVVAAKKQHLETIRTVCRTYGAQPFLVKGAFDPARLTQYFLERQT